MDLDFYLHTYFHHRITNVMLSKLCPVELLIWMLIFAMELQQPCRITNAILIREQRVLLPPTSIFERHLYSGVYTALNQLVNIPMLHVLKKETTQ